MSISSFIELRCARLYEYKLILNLVRVNCANMVHLLRVDQDFALSHIHGSGSLYLQLSLAKPLTYQKIFLACRRGYHEIVSLLVDWEPGLTYASADDGDLPLHQAAAFDQLRVVEQLCNSDTVNLTGAGGQTALHRAIVKDNISVVKFLVTHGADVDAGDQVCEENKSPLIVALEAENYEIVETLLDFNPDLESQDKEGWRPIHFAAEQGRTGLACRLLNLGCASEPLTNDGATPLFIAMDSSYIERSTSCGPILRAGRCSCRIPAPHMAILQQREDFWTSYINC